MYSKINQCSKIDAPASCRTSSDVTTAMNVNKYTPVCVHEIRVHRFYIRIIFIRITRIKSGENLRIS